MGTVTKVKSKFELFRNISNKNVTIKYPLYKRTEDSKSQYMLYNDKMEPIYDFLNYSLYAQLHWSMFYIDLIEAIKEEIEYEIE